MILIFRIECTQMNGNIVYGDFVSFEKVLTPSIGLNVTLDWGKDKTIQLSNASVGKRSPVLVSTNIPLGQDVSNDEEFLKIYPDKSYANMLAHFNCKKSDETCIQLKTDIPTFSSCLLVASVDGYDHVTINSSLHGSKTDMNTWEVDAIGKFSNNESLKGYTSGRIMNKFDFDHISLGCFEESSKNNLNYILLHPSLPIDSIQICYKSFSEASEYVLYSLVECDDTSKSSFSISGYIFSDKLYSSSRIGNPPIEQKKVFIAQINGTPIYSLNGTLIKSMITDERGFYYFDNLPRGSYQVFVANSFDTTTYFSPITDSRYDEPYTNKGDYGMILIGAFHDAVGVLPVKYSLFDDMKLTSIYVIREMNIGILPLNISLDGLVFVDYNGNGIMDLLGSNFSATDIPFRNIEVHLLDGDRVVSIYTTGENGTFIFEDVPYIDTGYMVKIITPSGFTMTNYPIPPAPAPGVPVELRIYQNVSLPVGMVSNALYCQDSPYLAIICYANEGHNESHANDPVLISFPTNVTKHLYNNPEGTVIHIATHKEIGAVYGLGIDRKNGDIYTSAFMKYFSGFGPHGTGAIYKSHKISDHEYTNELFFDLNEKMFISKGISNYCGKDNHVYPMEYFDEGVNSVGKVAFGDLDILDGYIYTVVLETRELLKLSINDPNDFELLNISNPCTDEPDDWRPFALGIRNGDLIIGGLCSMETNQTGDPIGYVIEFGGDIILTIPLDFPRGCKAYGGAFCIPGKYSPWSDVYFESQPWITDLTMDDQDLIISIRDRGGDLDRDIGTYDVLRACWDGTQLQLENLGICGSRIGAHTLPSGYFGTLDGISGGEFYDDNFYFPPYNNGHDNVATTSGVVIPGYRTLFGSSLDVDYIGQGTVKVWDNTNGHLLYGIGVYIQNNEDPTNNFGKANGLGDMEGICFNIN